MQNEKIMKIRIIFERYGLEAMLYDTPTGKDIYNSLPISGSVNTWGDEIYFSIPVDADLEPEASVVTDIGDLGFWPPMSAFCIFFGPTPASTDARPAAASEVNIFGKLGHAEPDKLRRIRSGESIRIEKVL